jgi:predicted protein tyrosine phosphatase
LIKPVRITSREKLLDILKRGEKHYSHCVSIGSPGSPRLKELKKHFRKVLFLRFHDIDRNEDMPGDQHPRPPRIQHIRRAVRFFEKTIEKADGYNIHCHAGVHRSVAIGLIYLHLMHGTDEKAKDALLKVHPLPLPNRKMIRDFDSIRGSNLEQITEELYQRFRDNFYDEISIDQDDYLEELDSAVEQ